MIYITLQCCPTIVCTFLLDLHFSSLKLFTKAESLGGIEYFICHQASMTHASVPKDVRESVGITDSLFRLSVGIENSEDLIKDVKLALDKIGI